MWYDIVRRNKIMPNFHTDKIKLIKKICRNKRVLDIGCVNHTIQATQKPDWQHRQIKDVAAELVGLDYEVEAIKQLQKEGWQVIAADAQNFDIRRKYPKGFEVIVASEIIEHLINPGAFLASVTKHLSSEGIFLMTTPHAYGLAFFLEILIFGEENINDDHTMTFSRKNIFKLMEKCGFEIKEFQWLIQDSSYSATSIIDKLQRKIFYWLQCAAATLRVGFSKEMIVIAVPARRRKK